MVANIERSTAKALRAGKQYIYAWGDGHAEGDASMRDLLGGKGAGLAEMTKAGLPVPPGFTITTDACNDYFRNGEELPGGLWEDVLAAVTALEVETGKTFGSGCEPAARQRALGRQILDAGHDGHRPQSRPQRRNHRRFGRADRRRAIRLGCLPPLLADVRPHRARRRRRELRARVRREKGPARSRGRHRARRRGAARARSRIQEHHSRKDRRSLSRAAAAAARPRDPRRVPQLVWATRPRLSAVPPYPRRPRHGRQRRDDGIRQHGPRLRHRRRLHARPEHRRERAVR